MQLALPGSGCWLLRLYSVRLRPFHPPAGVLGVGVGDLAAPFAAGVAVDARGVLSTKVFNDPTGQLGLERRRAAKAALNPKVAAFSKLRKVSLNRLEDAVKARIALGQKPTDEMLNLAGLTRIEYVFCIPETKDIVIAGPAEGWAPDLSGRICGILTGRPIVQLEDLIVALRAFPPNGKPTPLIGCSIDPTKEGLQREQDFARANKPRSPADIDAFATGLRNALGLETVTINGVPDTTHFAQVLVEADYRMKLIGIGLEQPHGQDQELRRSGQPERYQPRTDWHVGFSCRTTSASAWPTTTWPCNWSARA